MSPTLETVDYPDGLGLFTGEYEPVEVLINQPYGASPNNLSLDRIYLQYANSTGLFPTSGNKVPGTWLAVENCSIPARLQFRPSGLLLPGRKLRVVMTTDFEDTFESVAGLCGYTLSKMAGTRLRGS